MFILQYTSWNVRGLASCAKRRRVLAFLRRHNTHVAFIQETHMSKERLDCLSRSCKGSTIGTTISSFARGVLIWIARDTLYTIISHVVDPDGRYVVIEGVSDELPLAFVAVYGQTQVRAHFLRQLPPHYLQIQIYQ